MHEYQYQACFCIVSANSNEYNSLFFKNLQVFFFFFPTRKKMKQAGKRQTDRQTEDRDTQRQICVISVQTQTKTCHITSIQFKCHCTALTTIMIRYITACVFCPVPVLGPSEATEISLKVTPDVTDTPCAYCTTWTRNTERFLLLFLSLDVVVLIVV